MFLDELLYKAFDGEPQAIMFWGSLYWFCVCLVSVFIQLRLNKWPSVRGQLVHSGLEQVSYDNIRADRQFTASALYTYEVEGREYSGSKVSAWVLSAGGGFRSLPLLQLKGIKRFADGTVDVYYHPDKPYKSLLIKPGVFSVMITLLIGLLPVIFYLAQFT